MVRHPVSKGFTLLEVLLVVATLGILAAIVILAINPAKMLADARNAQRRIDVNTISNAVYEYAVDNNGTLPANITATATPMCKTGGTCGALIDLSVLTTGQKYIVSIPFDPSSSTPASAGYTIMSSSTTGRITVAAPAAENGVTVSITR